MTKPTEMHRFHEFDNGDKFLIGINTISLPKRVAMAPQGFVTHNISAVLVGNLRDEYAVYRGITDLDPSDDDMSNGEWFDEMEWIAKHGTKLNFKDACREFLSIEEQYYRR